MENIQVIIVVYNGLRNNWIAQCINSLEKSLIPLNIIVVDNCSTDNSVEYITKNFENVLLIQSNENLGFGKANNLGIKKALELNADFVFLLNQDAHIQPSTIKNLVTKSKENPQYGIISPIHLNGKGNALDYNFSNYIKPSHCKDLYSDFVLNTIKNKVYESGFICAAAWLVTKKCLEDVGGFNPIFFHYAEDDNYINRIHYKKYKIGVLPTSFIYHDRENRVEKKNENVKSYYKIIEMKINVKFSNPYNKESPHQFVFINILKLVFNMLIFNMTKSKLIFHQLKYFIKNKKQILNHLNLSKSNNKFIFINNS